MWENDTFVPPDMGSDEFYTNGIRFAIVRTDNWKWTEAFGEWWMDKPLIGADAEYNITSTLVLGQNFFTPSVITTFRVNPDDRPYAGFLYGGVRVDVTRADAMKQHSFEFDAGIMGPAALSDELQTAVHLLRQSRIPKGWEHEVGTQLGLQFQYLFRLRAGWSFADVVPHIGGALGTIQTYANAGATVRIGYNLTGFPSVLIPWTAAPVEERPPWEIAVYTAVDGRALAYNAYLDGTLIGGSPSVDKEPFVADWRAIGVTVRVHSWRFTYNMVRRTQELASPPPGTEGYHNFGSLSISRELGGAR